MPEKGIDIWQNYCIMESTLYRKVLPVAERSRLSRRVGMVSNLDLKQLERKAFRSTFQDGLWDIFLGLLLLNMGGGTLLGGSGMSPLWAMVGLTGFAGLVLLLFWAGKKTITTFCRCCWAC
jgi:hypothetical protein